MNTQYDQPSFAPLDAVPQPNAASFQAIYDEAASQDPTLTNPTDEYGSTSNSTVEDNDRPNPDHDDEEMDDDDMDDNDEDDSGDMEHETPDEMPVRRVPDNEMPSQRDMRI